jgi:hypothetical protein
MLCRRLPAEGPAEERTSYGLAYAMTGFRRRHWPDYSPEAAKRAVFLPSVLSFILEDHHALHRAAWSLDSINLFSQFEAFQAFHQVPTLTCCQKTDAWHLQARCSKGEDSQGTGGRSDIFVVVFDVAVG